MSTKIHCDLCGKTVPKKMEDYGHQLPFNFKRSTVVDCCRTCKSKLKELELKSIAVYKDGFNEILKNLKED